MMQYLHIHNITPKRFVFEVGGIGGKDNEPPAVVVARGELGDLKHESVQYTSPEEYLQFTDAQWIEEFEKSIRLSEVTFVRELIDKLSDPDYQESLPIKSSEQVLLGLYMAKNNGTLGETLKEKFSQLDIPVYKPEDLGIMNNIRNDFLKAFEAENPQKREGVDSTYTNLRLIMHFEAMITGGKAPKGSDANKEFRAYVDEIRAGYQGVVDAKK